MISGSDISVLSKSTALEGAHDLDAIARMKRGLRPGRARNDAAVERDRDAALAGVERFLVEQGGERRDAERFLLPVDPNAGRDRSLRHDILLQPSYSAAAARDGRNRSMPNGRIAGSTTPSSTRRAIVSAVSGGGRIP